MLGVYTVVLAMCAGKVGRNEQQTIQASCILAKVHLCSSQSDTLLSSFTEWLLSISVKQLIKGIFSLLRSFSFCHFPSPIFTRRHLFNAVSFNWCPFIQALGKCFPPCFLTSLPHTLTRLSYQPLISSLFLLPLIPFQPTPLSTPILLHFCFYSQACMCLSASHVCLFCFPTSPSLLRFSSSDSASYSGHLRLILHSLSYLISGWVFSRFSGDELFSLPWIRPVPLILLEQQNTTLHFMVDWSCVMEAFEEF